jgi:type II secretion system protein N
MTRKAALRTAGYISFFLFFTLVFTALNFPRENLTGAVNRYLSRMSKGALSVQEAAPALPFSVRVSEVSLVSDGERQVLGSGLLSPDLRALLAGKKGVVAGFEGAWGSSRFRVRSGKDGWRVGLKSLVVDLSVFPLAENLPISLSGNARMSGVLNTEGSSDQLLNGNGTVTGEDIQVAGGFLDTLGLSPLGISDFTGSFSVRDNVLTFGENLLKGDLTAKAEGSVRLVPARLENSRLDLTIEIEPGRELMEKVGAFFSMINARPGPDGKVRLRVRGSARRPSITGG